MKLILVLAAACSAVSAMNLRQVVPSSAPGPERLPITCAEKDAFNQICSNVGKVPTDTGFECCQWSNQCGPGVPKCLERNCCQNVGPGTGPPTPPQPENPIELPAHVMTCDTKLLVNPGAFECDVGSRVRTDGFLCCQWTPNPNTATRGCAPFGATVKCLERTCCVTDDTPPPPPPQPELPAHVMTCETKLLVNPGAFECAVGSRVRTDDFLCCQWTPNPNTATRGCAPFGATVKCLERTCCV